MKAHNRLHSYEFRHIEDNGSFIENETTIDMVTRTQSRLSSDNNRDKDAVLDAETSRNKIWVLCSSYQNTVDLLSKKRLSVISNRY